MGCCVQRVFFNTVELINYIILTCFSWHTSDSHPFYSRMIFASQKEKGAAPE